MDALVLFVVIFSQVLTFAIIVRVLLSWVALFRRQAIDPYNPIYQALLQITEPILAPIRNLLPTMGIDFSPIIAILILQFLSQAIQRSLS